MGEERSALCAFADWFPGVVASELEQAKSLYHQSRETSWTDRMLLELKKLRDPRIVVQGSNERLTGADMDWHFVRRDGQRHIHLAVQAKILHYTKPRTPDRYDDLAYPKRSGKQSRQLVNYARKRLREGIATYPLYLFYNPASATNWPLLTSPGITLASGFRIAHHLTTSFRMSRDRKVALEATEFETIEPLMFLLSDIFCCEITDVPDPDNVAFALGNIEDEMHAITINGPRVPTPGASELVPQDIKFIVDRLRDDVSASMEFEGGDGLPLKRPRVIFVSGDR
jgi:hypothetical protein